jgi:hypothetical protein
VSDRAVENNKEHQNIFSCAKVSSLQGGLLQNLYFYPFPKARAAALWRAKPRYVAVKQLSLTVKEQSFTLPPELFILAPSLFISPLRRSLI